MTSTTSTLGSTAAVHTAGHGRARSFRELYRLDAAFTDIRPLGPVADGFRMDGHFGGTVTTGELAGASAVGVDYFRVRSDGVGVVTAHEMVTLGDRAVAVEIRGFILPPPGVRAPRPDDIVRPGFAWPEQAYTIQASATFVTSVPEWAHLNRMVAVHTGTVNFVTGEIKVDAYRLD